MTGKFFKAWLSSRRFFFLFLAILLSLILLFSYIFGASVVIIGYQLLLSLIGAGFCLLLDLRREYGKVSRLEAGQRLELASASAAERILAEKLAEAEQACRELQVSERLKREELMDYFTLWAHQIKIPLTASRLLLNELPDSHGLEQELFKVEQYTAMAMNYLRLESFHEDLVLATEDLHDLVRQAVKKYALFFIQKKITLQFEEFDRSLVTDKKWFAIILEQVISNSLKYTRAGSIRIFVEGDWLVIADTGIGIQPSDLSRVFERGFSGFNGRVSQQSSGLGLYLSKTIADRLGHRLVLTSEVGKGTQVRIDLGQAELAQN